MHEKDELSQVGEALGEDLDYDGDEGDSTSGSSIYISSNNLDLISCLSRLLLTNIQISSTKEDPSSLSLFIEPPIFRSMQRQYKVKIVQFDPHPKTVSRFKFCFSSVLGTRGCP